MSNEFEVELTIRQWEVLKALRTVGANPTMINRVAVDRLVSLGFIAVRGESFAITPAGRKVLIRGSSRLLHDLAA